MRLLTTLLLSFLCLVIKSQNESLIYTYDGAGNVISKSEFIQALDFATENPTYLPVAQRTVLSSDKTYSYGIQLKQLEEAAGDKDIFEAIDITCGGRNILSLHCWEAWRANTPLSETRSVSDYLTVKHLDIHVTALVFLGWPYDSTPPLITIILLNKDKAEIVFNQRGYVEECTNAMPYGLNIVYVDQTQEYDGTGKLTPPDSELKKYRIWQEGQYLKYARIQ